MLEFLFTVLLNVLTTLFAGAVASQTLSWFVTPIFGGPYLSFKACVGFSIALDVFFVPIYVAIGSLKTEVTGVMRILSTAVSYLLLLLIAAFFHFALGI